MTLCMDFEVCALVTLCTAYGRLFNLECQGFASFEAHIGGLQLRVIPSESSYHEAIEEPVGRNRPSELLSCDLSCLCLRLVAED